MSDQSSPFNEVIESWTQAEQDVWNAWSAVERDLSQSDSPSTCSHVLEAAETWTRDLARAQSVILRGTCEQMSANPFVPPLARTWFAQACGTLTSLSDLQQHLLVGWFGMARHAADLHRHANNPDS